MSEKILRGTLKRFESLMETRYSFCVVLVFCLAAYNFFYHLGAGPVYDWDEARNGVNTYEMLQNHDFCAGTFNHQLDHWNLKPPLGDWCILLGYRLFGFSIMGLRFYSAFSCLLMVIILLAVLPGIFGKIPTLLAGFVLTMTPLFIYAHGARTGDFCSLFCLFYILFLVCLYKAGDRGGGLFLPLAGICFALGFLVYSYHAVQLLVILIAYLFLTGLYREVSFGRYVGFFLCAFLPIAGWTIWRGSYPDGAEFLKTALVYDAVGRTTQVIEGHGGDWRDYFRDLGRENPYWSLYMAVGLLLYFAVVGFKADIKNKPLILVVLGTLVPLTLFSIVPTKLVWYIDPIYPPLAVLTGWLTIRLLKEPKIQKVGKVIVFLLVTVAMIRSEREIWKIINIPDSRPSQKLLSELVAMNVPPRSEILKASWGQADRFMAEVVCGLNPVSFKNPEDALSESGFIMLEKDTTKANESFVRKNHLEVYLQNEEWMVVKL
jgi:4-amino-4-deoxy-L-arabinose transferase-like glycosyltransferase